jgi:alpha-beta hydrolase superfamily lysophospholipase
VLRPPVPIKPRLAILCGAALVGWLLLWWIPSTSERWHALLLPLWALNFYLSGQKVGKMMVAYGAGITLGLVIGLWTTGSTQANAIGARLTWDELAHKIYFGAGVFVLYALLCAALNGLVSLWAKGRELLKAPRGWWLRTLRMGVALCLFTPYLYATFNFHRFKYANVTNPQQRYGLKFQEWNFQASDGTRLSGWWIPAKDSRQTIVVVHGVGSNKGDASVVAPFLHRAGFNVLLFDLRGHGDSGGHTVSFGLHEALDVNAAVELAAKNSQSVGLYAFSMGGSAALHAIGRTGLPQAKAVILDSTFAELLPLTRSQMAFLPETFARPLLKSLSFYSWLEIGSTLENIAPQRYIGQIAPRPLLLLHGTRDSLIDPKHAQQNFARAKQPKQLHWMQGAEHCTGLWTEGKAYEKRVVSFFKKNL